MGTLVTGDQAIGREADLRIDVYDDSPQGWALPERARETDEAATSGGPLLCRRLDHPTRGRPRQPSYVVHRSRCALTLAMVKSHPVSQRPVLWDVGSRTASVGRTGQPASRAKPTAKCSSTGRSTSAHYCPPRGGRSRLHEGTGSPGSTAGTSGAADRCRMDASPSVARDVGVEDRGGGGTLDLCRPGAGWSTVSLAAVERRKETGRKPDLGRVVRIPGRDGEKTKGVRLLFDIGGKVEPSGQGHHTKRAVRDMLDRRPGSRADRL